MGLLTCLKALISKCLILVLASNTVSPKRYNPRNPKAQSLSRPVKGSGGRTHWALMLQGDPILLPYVQLPAFIGEKPAD